MSCDGMVSVVRKVANGIITTVAGTGTPGFSGDGGAATSASLNLPRGLAIDATGNLFIADQGNQRIRRVAGGVITTVAGSTIGYAGDGGPAVNAKLSSPLGISFDIGGNLYIADQGNYRIRVLLVGGTISTVAGNGLATYGGDGGPALLAALNTPVAVAASAAGVYVADSCNLGLTRQAGEAVFFRLLGTNPADTASPSHGMASAKRARGEGHVSYVLYGLL
jgi:hypothetical protein